MTQGSGLVAKYVVYCLNEAGKIWRREWIDADGDEEAIAAAQEMKLPNGCEIWDHDRFIGKVEACMD